MGTAAGGGLLILLGCHYIYTRLSAYSLLPEVWADYNIVVHIGVPLILLAALGFGLFRVLNGQRSGDFLINVESEMKKVNWTSKREVIGSTKVVILTLLLLGTFLAAIDLAFMTFFRWIGVLQF
jgi:preprotein translocase SecE subunit